MHHQQTFWDCVLHMIPAPTRHMFCGLVFCDFNNFFGTAFWVSLPKCSLVWDAVARYVWFSVSNFPVPWGKRGEHTSDALYSLWERYEAAFDGELRPPFLGYWAPRQHGNLRKRWGCSLPTARWTLSRAAPPSLLHQESFGWWGCFGVQNRGTLAEQVQFTSANPCLEEHRHNDDRCTVKYFNMYMYLYMFVYVEICPYTYRYGYNRYGHAGPKHHQGYNNILPFSVRGAFWN